MTPLDLPGLIVIAMRTLGLDTAGALAELDVTAAEAALAEAAAAGRAAAAPAARPPGPAPAAGARPGGGRGSRHGWIARQDAAAALLCALLRHRPFRHGNAPVAVAAATTFLALGGWQADLEPPGAVREVVAAVEAGRLRPRPSPRGWPPGSAPGSSRPGSGHGERSPAGRGAARRGQPGPATADDRPRAEEGTMQGWLPGRSRPGRKKGMFRRFSPRAREAIIDSQQEARSLRHGYIGTEHLLLGLLREADGVAGQALHAAGITEEAARQRIVEIIGRGAQEPAGHIPFTARAKKVLELALREAVAAQPPLHRHRAHPARPAPGGRRGRLPGAHRPGRGQRPDPRAGDDTAGRPGRRARRGQASSRRTSGTSTSGSRRPGQQKDAAIDAGTSRGPRPLRERESELLAERDRRLAQWRAGADPEALGREIDRLREEVRRLQDLLLQHGIDAGEPGQRSA